MNTNATKTVRDLAVEIPGATRVFEKVGIDYCCGGNRSLVSACADAGVNVEELLSSLDVASSSDTQSQAPNFSMARLSELMDHIVSKHHVFTRTEIERLQALLGKVCGVHGQNHPELDKLRTLFELLSAELEPHMMKEERVLFPYIIGMEDSVCNEHGVGMPPFGTVANPINRMMMEHDAAGDMLKEMRRITSSYAVPEDACISFRTLYQALDEFEKDLHQHIHLENNILFPRAVEMEKGLVKSSA